MKKRVYIKYGYFRDEDNIIHYNYAEMTKKEALYYSLIMTYFEIL